MAKEAKWVINRADEEEEEESAVSLTDLPVTTDCCISMEAENFATSPSKDFEFRILSSGSQEPNNKSTNICIADKVFFKGQMLPLRPSFTAPDTTALLRSSSRSDSLDCVTTTSTGSSEFSSGSNSRSASSNSSSSGSRSYLSKSASSGSGSGSTGNEVVPPRRSVSNNFYTFPSPTPQIRGPRRSNASGSTSARRSTGSAPPSWGLIRLGVVGAPDVYPPPRPEVKKTVRACSTKGTGNGGNAKFGEDNKCGGVTLGSGGFGCKCSPDAIEPVSFAAMGKKKNCKKTKKEEERKSSEEEEVKKKNGAAKRSQSFCSKRIFEWLEL